MFCLLFLEPLALHFLSVLWGFFSALGSMFLYFLELNNYAHNSTLCVSGVVMYASIANSGPSPTSIELVMPCYWIACVHVMIVRVLFAIFC